MSVVRETAGTESPQGDQTSFALICVVIVGILWNLAFVAVAVTILVLSRDQNPSEPLRAWIIGYAVKCVVDMLLLACTHCQSILTELLDSVNTLFTFIWWIIGICWICAGGQTLIEDAPQLYWLSVAFITCDVITIVFRCVSAVAVSLGICLCLSPIMSILFPMGDNVCLRVDLLVDVLVEAEDLFEALPVHARIITWNIHLYLILNKISSMYQVMKAHIISPKSA